MSFISDILTSPLNPLHTIFGIIDKIIPDRDAAEKAKQQAQAAYEAGELQKELAQLTVNMEEAKSSSLFVAGWRPFIGWVCGSAFLYHFILQPLFIFAAGILGHPVPVPSFDIGSLMTVLMGMLGLGG